MPRINERDELAIVTCFFTPEAHPRRVQNFEAFRGQFNRSLYIAELAFGQQPWLSSDGPNTLHFRGEVRHVMWQKERLLNAVIAKLPPRVTHVAWVDADVIFQDPDWPRLAVEQLRSHPVIQLFDSVISLDHDGFPDLQLTGIIAGGGSVGASAMHERSGTTGFAWAARREVLESVPLLECMILGGADACMAAGFAGTTSAIIRDHLPRRLRRTVEAWLNKAKVATGGNVGYLPGTIEHLFHGSFATRAYIERYAFLRKADFDPIADLLAEPCGLYAWKAPSSTLATNVREYFGRRTLAEN
jgi:hypothetical protein